MNGPDTEQFQKRTMIVMVIILVFIYLLRFTQ